MKLHPIIPSIACCCVLLFINKSVQAQRLPELGITSSLNNDSIIHAAGFNYIGLPVGSTIGPSVSEQQFLQNVRNIKQAKTKVFMCNVLFPGSIKIAGPQVNEARVLGYLDSVLIRAKTAGIKNLILGSGGARKLPAGYDKQLATNDFVPLARKMAILAKKYRIRIILENLNSTETNFLTTLKEASAVVRRVNHPNLRLNADIYHMMMEKESPQEIINSGKFIVYSEVAEKEQRTLPGVMKEDFRAYLAALKQIKFKGPIIIEGRTDDFRKEVPQAFKYLTAQLKEVYTKN